jgi:hypothetical protein
MLTSGIGWQLSFYLSDRLSAFIMTSYKELLLAFKKHANFSIEAAERTT